MRTTKVVSLSFPPKLLRSVERLARREGRTRSELFREAVQAYVAGAEERSRALRESQACGRRRAKALGIRTEDDVQRLIDAYRRSKTPRRRDARRR